MDAMNEPETFLPGVEVLHLPQALWDQMHQDVAQRAPEEACGLVGGQFAAQTAQASHVWPVENMLHSPVRYRLDPYQQLAVFETIDAQGLALIGVYHSHPRGPDNPSPTDIAEAYCPEVVHLIWSGSRGVWQCRAFTVRDGVVHPVAIEMDLSPG